MRQLSEVWDHWEVTTNDDGTKKIACKFCHASRIHKNATKCADHTLKCQARIEQGVEFVKPNKRYSKTPKKMKLNTVGSSEEDDSDDDLLGGSSLGNLNSSSKKRALEFISDLLQFNEPQARKPLSKYTEEDFKREERELGIKKMRAEVKLLEQKSGIMDKLDVVLDKVGVALETYVNQAGLIVYPNEAQNGPVHSPAYDVPHDVAQTVTSDD